MGLDDFGGGHLDFINESLQSLDDSLRVLGAHLTVKVGDAVDVLKQLHSEYSFDAIYSHQETGNLRPIVEIWLLSLGQRLQNLPWHEFRQFGVVRGLKTEMDGLDSGTQ